jgi:hypothetical protein
MLSYELSFKSLDGRVTIKYFDTELEAQLEAERAYQLHTLYGDNIEIQVAEAFRHRNGQISYMILD